MRRTVIVLLVLAIAWPIGLLVWANSKLEHVDALSGKSDTPGTTYLLVGSDRRSSGSKVKGARSDTIMLLTKPPSGISSLVSIPRDSYVAIPGHGKNKINAAYAFGGPKLLTQTVEQLAGVKVDHYVEVGFDGLKGVVDAVGGVELCLDQDVSDKDSKLKWKAGCHVSDGATALAFSRMRHQDKKGDIGRAERQRQVIGAISKKVQSPASLLPWRQVAVLEGATGSLRVDEDSNILDLAGLALAFKAATGKDGFSGTPPISSMNYQPGGVGSAVRLDPDKTPQFFADIAKGVRPAS